MNRKKSIFDLHQEDARKIDKIVNKKIVDVIITSPPYFDMKDYGFKKQIGYGQKYETYVKDLKNVFKKCFDISKDTASLWIIMDTCKRNGEVKLLPFDLAKELKDIGWKLHDILIWKKDKTLPWSAKGEMRRIFEYVLFFVKGKKFKYYIDNIKDFKKLKDWWKRYPERYHPYGKTPEKFWKFCVWDFPIPLQGSWSNGYIRHFCPLPMKMVERIILLTTKEGDTVMDTFSGTGSVLAQAAYMNRKYIGFEMKKRYINQFNKLMKLTFENGKKDYQNLRENLKKHYNFAQTIKKLRQIKYAKFISKEIKKNINKKNSILNSIFVIPLKSNKNSIHCEYNLITNKMIDKNYFKRFLLEKSGKKPLSKFGILPEFKVFTIKEFEKFFKYKKKSFYLYEKATVHEFSRKINFNQWKKESKTEEWKKLYKNGVSPILSTIGVKV